MTCDLITSARALYNLNNLSLTSNEQTTLEGLITAVSAAVKQYTGREFCSTEHDELYNGSGDLRLHLKEYPLISVSRVAHCPTTVLKIKNTDSAVQRATVQVTSTGLSLVVVGSATTTTNLINFATYTTLSAVKTAIDSTDGWTADIPDSNFNLRASADLRAIQGSFNAKDKFCELRVHTEELFDYDMDTDKGFLIRRRNFDADPNFQNLPTWFGGVNYWRVIYTAGYATIPEDIQEAVAKWVAVLFWETKRDPGLRQEQIPGAISRSPVQGTPEFVRIVLDKYKKTTIVRFSG